MLDLLPFVFARVFYFQALPPPLFQLQEFTHVATNILSGVFGEEGETELELKPYRKEQEMVLTTLNHTPGRASGFYSIKPSNIGPDKQ